MTYTEKLKDPRWQKKRLEAMDSAGFKCEICGMGDSTLHVHHGYYAKNMEPWDYDLSTLHVLCEHCHAEYHAVQAEYKVVFGTIAVRDWVAAFRADDRITLFRNLARLFNGLADRGEELKRRANDLPR